MFLAKTASFSQHTVGFFFFFLFCFPWAHCKPTKQTLVGLQCDTNTFEKVWGKKKNKNQDHRVRRGGEVGGYITVFSQVAMHPWCQMALIQIEIYWILICRWFTAVVLVWLQSRGHPWWGRSVTSLQTDYHRFTIILSKSVRFVVVVLFCFSSPCLNWDFHWIFFTAGNVRDVC